MIAIETTSSRIRSLLFFIRALFADSSVLPKFRELCMELPCLCPAEGHKHGGRNVTKTSSLSFATEMKKLLLKSSDTLK